MYHYFQCLLLFTLLCVITADDQPVEKTHKTGRVGVKQLRENPRNSKILVNFSLFFKLLFQITGRKRWSGRDGVRVKERGQTVHEFRSLKMLPRIAYLQNIES